MTLREKLSQIQSEIKVAKTQFNKFGNYNYRSCEDITEAFKPIATKYNVALKIDDDILFVGDRFYVKATATLLDGESNETITTTALAREPLEKKGMDSAQVTGATSSYARKYALNGLFALDDVKDADTQAPTAEAPKKVVTIAPSDRNAELAEIKNLCKANPDRLVKMVTYTNNLNHTNYDTVDDMSYEHIHNIYLMLKK